MTTASSINGRGGAAVRAHSPDPLARLATPEGVAMGALMLAGFGLVFHDWLFRQAQIAIGSMQDWGHTLFVPAICVYLLWQRREDLASRRVETFWPGLLPLLVGVASHVYFIVGVSNHMLQGFSLVLAVFGAVLLVAGPGVMRAAFLPIAYLVFAVTFAEKIMIMLTFKLQTVAAQGSWAMLNMVGIHTDISGNVITVITSSGDSIPLNVAEQCSGMRTLVSFVALGAAVALVACDRWWQRAALLVLAVPVAIGVNVGRVAVLGMLSLYNPDLASGQAHTVIGTLLLVPAFGVYMLIVWIMNRLVRETADAGGGV